MLFVKMTRFGAIKFLRSTANIPGTDHQIIKRVGLIKQGQKFAKVFVRNDRLTSKRLRFFHTDERVEFQTTITNCPIEGTNQSRNSEVLAGRIPLLVFGQPVSNMTTRKISNSKIRIELGKRATEAFVAVVCAWFAIILCPFKERVENDDDRIRRSRRGTGKFLVDLRDKVRRVPACLAFFWWSEIMRVITKQNTFAVNLNEPLITLFEIPRFWTLRPVELLNDTVPVRLLSEFRKVNFFQKKQCFNYAGP